MAERVGQHKHCRNCDLAIPRDKDYCSDECRETRLGQLRQQRNRLYLWIAVGAAIVLLMTVLPLLGGG